MCVCVCLCETSSCTLTEEQTLAVLDKTPPRIELGPFLINANSNIRLPLYQPACYHIHYCGNDYNAGLGIQSYMGATDGKNRYNIAQCHTKTEKLHE
jgi:hypothetical protein